MLKGQWLSDGKGRHRVFIRLLIPYILFLILPMIVGWIIYQKTIQTMEKEVTANHMNVLEQSKDILERRLEEISSIAQQLSVDTRIIQFQPVIDPFEGTNTYRVLDTNKSLYNYKLSNNFIFNYYVLFKNSGLVLTPGSSYSIKEFYENIAKYSRLDYTSWNKLMFDQYFTRKYIPSQEVMVNNTSYTMLTYIQSLGYPGNPQGAIAVMIDNRELQKLFHGLDISGDGWAYIVDDQGQLISSLSADAVPLPVDIAKLSGSQGVVEQTIDKKPMMITYVKSASNGWTYLVGQPTHMVLEKVRYIQKITFSLTFLFLVIGVIIAYLLAYRNSMPLRNIVNMIMEKADVSPQHRDAYGLIGETVSGLINNNHRLKSEIEQQAPLLRAAYFQRLLNGEFLSVHDANALLKHVGMDVTGMSYVVAILHLRGLDNGYSGDLLEELDMKRVLTKEMLRKTMEHNGFVYDVAEDQLAVLFCCNQSQSLQVKEHIESKLLEADEAVGDLLKYVPIYGIGAIHDSLTGVSRSYEQARQALSFQLWQNREGILWFDELPDDRNNYYFPPDLEGRLMNLAKAGDRVEVKRILEDLYRENFEIRRLSFSVMQLFLYEVWGSIVKLLPQMELAQEQVFHQMKPLSSETPSYEHMKNNYASVISTYEWICDSVNAHKKSQNIQLVEHIITILNQDYMQDDLCLDVVADRIPISKVYLSQFFKEQTGINFSDYLESVRMDHAKALLLESRLTINDIAASVGYSSSNTFCRAFKRLHGVSATAYKKSQTG
ncbi:helix-turn-helix domain-containing protein [Paenibacillus periandrae]|uniref:helix-turn-helix domain-containing protein n=1 Tax=Paenibacillus periandrae TaxID=1761741 RepID=UPI001F0964F0|nr:helix-turn-helix domain-containing protein [Paenibacillus periandrae]